MSKKISLIIVTILFIILFSLSNSVIATDIVDVENPSDYSTGTVNDDYTPDTSSSQTPNSSISSEGDTSDIVSDPTYGDTTSTSEDDTNAGFTVKSTGTIDTENDITSIPNILNLFLIVLGVLLLLLGIAIIIQIKKQ